MTPPRLAERLMRWSLSPDDRPAVLGDLEEEFGALATANGSRRAAVWYWRQTLTSAGPNYLRRLRRAYLREFGSNEARAAQRQARRQSYLFLGLGIALLVADHFVLHDQKPVSSAALPAEIGLIFLGFSYFETGIRRRPKPGQGAVTLVLILGWAWAAISANDERFFLGILVCSGLLERWPRILWPVPARRQPPSYSVRTPIVTFRQADGSMFSTTTVPTEVMGMSGLVVARAARATIPEEFQLNGVAPMEPLLRREFSSTEDIRVFSVINANPDLLRATLEVRQLSDGRVARRAAVTVRKATPKLPPPIVARFDEIDRPKFSTTPMSELDVLLPLTGLSPGTYALRLVATAGATTSAQEDEITVTPAGRQAQP